MLSWPEDHPKARLMARTRASILDAARASFIESGFEGTSMEGIASSAGVSIMTLYRHARTKDELFEAIVSEGCIPGGELSEKELADLLAQPLRDILIFVGTLFQERLTRPETLGLLRAVMAVRRSMPHLAKAAYAGFIDVHIRELADLLGERPDGAPLESRNRRGILSSHFFDRLFGAYILEALLEDAVPSLSKRRHRAVQAADDLLAQL
jgi:TetR/AcrR family transcriptional repressor of mexJK operon